MRTINYLFIVCIAAIAGLISCSNKGDEVYTDSDVEKNVFFTLKASSTRAIGTGAKGKTTTISTGQLFLFDGGNRLERVYTLSDAATSESNINIDELKGSGVTILGTKSTTAYILANKTISVNVTDEISVVTESVLDISDLKTGGWENAILFGSSTYSHLSDNQYKAEVRVAPVISRIEIAEIAETSGKGYTFDMEGVFINNFYSRMYLNKTGQSNLINNLNDKAKYVENYPSATGLVVTPNSKSTALYDILSSVETKDISSFTPSGSQLLTYNIFPAKSIESADDLIPHIIVKMKNLKKNGALIYDDYYLTIRTYTKDGETFNDFEPGIAYKIEKIEFDGETDGDIEPEPQLKDVTVNVVIEQWGGFDIKANVN